MSETTKKLFDAIDKSNIKDFKEILATKVNINAKDNNNQNNTPLISIIDALVTASNEET